MKVQRRDYTLPTSPPVPRQRKPSFTSCQCTKATTKSGVHFKLFRMVSNNSPQPKYGVFILNISAIY